MSVQFVTAAEAAKMIKDGSTVGIDGFISFCLAEDILTELENSFVSTGSPRGLTVVNVAGIGGDGKDRGINHFAHEGMLGKLICSNLSLAEKIYPLITANAFPLYMIPQGVLANMTRAVASHKPGVITRVGMRTFVDPRVDGGRVNDAAKNCPDEVVKLVEIDGGEYLFYPAIPLDAAIIKGSAADEDGNITVEDEALHIEQLEMAEAARNSGGKVFVQVDRVVPRGSIHPRKVTVPSVMVDYVVVGRPEHTGQHFFGDRRPVPSWSGDEKVPLEGLQPLELSPKKVICRRGVFELHENDFINLGIGTPMYVSHVLTEEGLINQVSSSIESGVTGGVPAPAGFTGAAYNPVAILKQPDIFDYYDGGGIDFACVGAAEIDRFGNVDVSRFSGKVPGPGGFINITQGAKLVCFMGTFTAGKQDVRVGDGRLEIVKDGELIKFRENVEHITFSGQYALEKGTQKIFYITERAVFTLTEKGLTLIEIAPGADLERDVIGKMEFRPAIADDLKTMDEKLFRAEKIGLQLKKRV